MRKVKTGRESGKEKTERSEESEGPQAKKKYPKRGKRYSRAQKDEILNYSFENSIVEASAKFDVSETTIYNWIRNDKRHNTVEKVLRAYTAGINHAGRYEFEGLSRLQVLRRADPDPGKHRAFLPG
jgi:transposase-like protein